MKDLKDIFLTIFGLVFRPNEEWKCIASRGEDYREVQLHFYVPLLILVVVSSFLGVVLGIDSTSTAELASRSAERAIQSKPEVLVIELAMRSTLITLSLFVASYFLSIILVEELLKRWWNIDADYGKCLKFVTYSSSILFIVYTVDCIMPSFFAIRILCFCSAYMVWIGSVYFFPEIDEHKDEQMRNRTAFMIACVGMVSAISFVLYKVIYKLMS